MINKERAIQMKMGDWIISTLEPLKHWNGHRWVRSDLPCYMLLMVPGTMTHPYIGPDGSGYCLLTIRDYAKMRMDGEHDPERRFKLTLCDSATMQHEYYSPDYPRHDVYELLGSQPIDHHDICRIFYPLRSTYATANRSIM